MHSRITKFPLPQGNREKVQTAVLRTFFNRTFSRPQETVGWRGPAFFLTFKLLIMHLEGYSIGINVYAVLYFNRIVECYNPFFLTQSGKIYLIRGEFSEVIDRLEAALQNAGANYTKQTSSHGSTYIKIFLSENVVETIRFANHPNSKSEFILFDFITRNILVMKFIKKLENTNSLIRAMRYVKSNIRYYDVGRHRIYEFK